MNKSSATNLAPQTPTLAMWRVVVGVEVMVIPYRDTTPPTVTRHINKLWHLLGQNVWH